MTKEQINRIKVVGTSIWNRLTKQEQEAFYYDTGTIGFVECVADLLHIKLKLLDYEIIEELQAFITRNKK